MSDFETSKEAIPEREDRGFQEALEKLPPYLQKELWRERSIWEADILATGKAVKKCADAGLDFFGLRKKWTEDLRKNPPAALAEMAKTAERIPESFPVLIHAYGMRLPADGSGKLLLEKFFDTREFTGKVKEILSVPMGPTEPRQFSGLLPGGLGEWLRRVENDLQYAPGPEFFAVARMRFEKLLKNPRAFFTDNIIDFENSMRLHPRGTANREGYYRAKEILDVLDGKLSPLAPVVPIGPPEGIS